MSDYPELQTLISGWFHQDFDIEGETVPEIVAAYARSVPASRHVALIEEIDSFIRDNADGLDMAFEKAFSPDIDARAFSGSTLNFLSDVKAQLR
ncbi:hypothetical protein RGUI_3994 [Rhodovulum sp. P5]|uniref:contact-dependent growth inhibition system immunity protein n=1 Tax=Rhodovulum sp. P5 TaxID=1564506 RepID=UPI0009C2A2DF|nr:contact-dependent growth inhibition system immunity protein [Rhodovulum sp. P5]ARE42135.1 hypothetical protein RGUI_3994 [Rhodovulum sp. P5]